VTKPAKRGYAGLGQRCSYVNADSLLSVM
jgi:hypothetical protein